MCRAFCGTIIARLARFHRRQPTAPHPPKRKNPFQPSGRKGLNQPSRLYKNDFTPAHSSQQNCPNPKSPHTHESRPLKSTHRRPTTRVIPSTQAPHLLSFRRASEARQEESAVRRQRISPGCPISRVLCEKWASRPVTSIGLRFRNPRTSPPQPLSFRRASEARQEESAVRRQRISPGCRAGHPH